MGMDQLKRANVIAAFETEVNKLILSDDDKIHHSGIRRFCVAIPKPLVMNVKEEEFVIKHYKSRKSYQCEFATLGEIKEGKTSIHHRLFAPSLARHIEMTHTTEPESSHFIISRAS